MSSEVISVERKRKRIDDPNDFDDQKESNRETILLPSKPYWVDKTPCKGEPSKYYWVDKTPCKGEPSKYYWVDKTPGEGEERGDNTDLWSIPNQKPVNLDSCSNVSKSDSDGFDWSRVSTNYDWDNRHAHHSSRRGNNVTDRISKISSSSTRRASSPQKYRDIVNDHLMLPLSYRSNYRYEDQYSKFSRPRSLYPRQKVSYPPYHKSLSPSPPRHPQHNNKINSISSISPHSSAITDIKYNLDNSCKSAANILTKFIQDIGSLLIEATKNFLGAPIVIQYFADGTDPAFYQGDAAFDAKRIGYSRNGFYMLREFHQEIEEYLKKEFPTSKVESNGNDKNWTVAISNFIDARKVRKHFKK